MGILARIDDENPSTTDGIFYTERSHGGLGLQRIETIVKLAVVRSGIKMRESTDLALQQLSENLDKRCNEYARSLGIP
jgi:hypothetical protein